MEARSLTKIIAKSLSDAIKLTIDLCHSGWSFQSGYCNNCILWRDSEFTLGDKYFINCDRRNMRILGLTFDLKTRVLDPNVTLVQWYVAFLFDEYTGSIHWNFCTFWIITIQIMRHPFQENIEHLVCSKLKSLMACRSFCPYISGHVTALFRKKILHGI